MDEAERKKATISSSGRISSCNNHESRNKSGSRAERTIIAPADYCGVARRGDDRVISFVLHQRAPDARFSFFFLFLLFFFFYGSLSARHKLQRGGIKKRNFIIFSFNEIPPGDVVPLWHANLYPALFAPSWAAPSLSKRSALLRQKWYHDVLT